MDYGGYVEGRREAWTEAGRVLGARVDLRGLDFDGVEALVATHRQLSAELGVVQSRWPGSEAEAVLRRLVLHGHRLFAPPAPSLVAQLTGFLRYEYPALYRASAPALRLSVAVFLASVWLGLVLGTFNDGLTALVVGPEQLEQLRHGEIWTDELADTSPALLAVKIFVNNIRVALLAWAGGALLGLGTTWILLTNGLMVGCLIATCARYGILDRLFAFIPAHGVLELFLILVAGAAGYELTRGVLGEGDGPLGERFSGSAVRSMRLVVGTLPWLVLLGVVEGFVSPEMGFPTSAKVVVGLLIFSMFQLYTRMPARSP